MRLRPVLTAGALVAVGTVTIVTAAVGTPGSGTTVTTDSVTGRLDGSEGRGVLKVQQDGVRLTSHGPTDVTTFDLTYPPGAYSGWHSHPGIVVVVVRSGEVVRQTGCTSQRFGPGDAFTEVGPHQVTNPPARRPSCRSRGSTRPPARRHRGSTSPPRAAEHPCRSPAARRVTSSRA